MKTKKTLLRDRMILKRLVESYGKKDVLNFVKHLNESVTGSRYTSLQLANLADMFFENDDDTLYDVAEQIAKPWNDALRRVNLEPGIGISEDLDPDDVRDSGHFHMCIDTAPHYIGIYDCLIYNGIETTVAPGIRIDEMGRVNPTIYAGESSENIYVIEEMTPDAFASKFKTLLSYQNKNRDVDELINRLFRVIEVE